MSLSYLGSATVLYMGLWLLDASRVVQILFLNQKHGLGFVELDFWFSSCLANQKDVDLNLLGIHSDKLF